MTGLSAAHIFYTLRVLLGIAEAGFFPGIIFLLTLWFATAYRARVVGYFMVAIPLFTVIRAPISDALLNLDKLANLAGWQWLRHCLPCSCRSWSCSISPTNQPMQPWLAADERDGW